MLVPAGIETMSVERNLGQRKTHSVKGHRIKLHPEKPVKRKSPQGFMSPLFRLGQKRDPYSGAIKSKSITCHHTFDHERVNVRSLQRNERDKFLCQMFGECDIKQVLVHLKGSNVVILFLVSNTKIWRKVLQQCSCETRFAIRTQ